MIGRTSKELKKKEIHARWLTTLLGKASSLAAWGTVWSGYDSNDGWSSMEVR